MSFEYQIMKARSAAIIHPDLVDKNPVPNYLSRVYSVPEFKPKTVPEFTARRRPIYKPNWPYFFSSHDDKWKFRFYRYLYDDSWYNRFDQYQPFKRYRSFQSRAYYSKYWHDSPYRPYSRTYNPFNSYLLTSS